jgi:FkbM family methyltransferase
VLAVNADCGGLGRLQQVADLTERRIDLIEFPSFNQLADCRYGRMLFNRNDRYIGKSLSLYGEYSQAEIDLFHQILKPGSLVVEVGANIGTHTLFFARQVGLEGAVVAFEPQPLVFQTLCANMALNCVTNVRCFQKAVGAEPREILVPALDCTREDNYGGLSLEGGQRGEPTPMVTLDSLNLDRCALLKVDVEGMEQQVLAGAAKTIAKCLPILYVENDRREKAAALVQFIDGLGYAMYWHLPPLFNPENFLRNPDNVFGNTVSINMVCIQKSVPHHLDGFRPVQLDTPSLV